IVRRLDGSFPEGRGAVRVVYTAGYASVPGPVIQAAIMLVADWYRNRPDGRAVREAFDGYQATYAEELLPRRVRELLEPYRRRRLA
ncbi:MAG: phage gp6-like head-tail connector protein, partial [Armatimonadetes bacterium]|nr:phage gp6-like head-tail connector protein [Armatimonadota bacterium]